MGWWGFAKREQLFSNYVSPCWVLLEGYFSKRISYHGLPYTMEDFALCSYKARNTNPYPSPRVVVFAVVVVVDFVVVVFAVVVGVVVVAVVGVVEERRRRWRRRRNIYFQVLFAVLVFVGGLFPQANIMPWATLHDGGIFSLFVQGL